MSDVTVNVDLRDPSSTGTDVPANGVLICKPTLRRNVDTHVTLPAEFSVKLVAGLATIVLAETTSEWCWKFTERSNRGATRYCAVTGPGPVNYGDLVDVDPKTLDPATPIQPVWLAYVETAIADAIDGILDGAPTAMDTLAELAAALGDDPNFATTVINGLAGKVDQTTYNTAIATLTTGLASKADDAATSAALATKVNSSTYTAGLAAKADTTALTVETTARTNADALKVDKASNLSDLASAPTARTNLGLGNVDNTSDANKPVSTAQAAAVALKVGKPAGPMQFVIYGASQSVDPGLRCTPGKEWFKQVAAELGTTITSLAYSGRRTTDMASYALSGTVPVTGQGAHPAGAAATWAGMDTVGKIPILDVSMNDIGHYPSMAVSPAVPALITGAAGTRYLAGIGGALRCLLATMISQSRVENTAATSTGTWSSAAIGSGGTTSYTTVVGATRTYTVTPPQGGEFAGDVYFVGVTLSVESGAVSSPFTYSIDGGAESALQTPPGWERYVGWGGANIDSTNYAIKISLPIDGAAHTIRFTHAGAAGNIFYCDPILVPSETPQPIPVLAAPRQVKSVAGTFTAAGVATYARNWRVIEDQQKAICAEFPNVVYVPCNMTPNGLSSVDGLHGNDRGEEQRANDFLSALYTNLRLRAALTGNTSRAASDSNYATL